MSFFFAVAFVPLTTLAVISIEQLRESDEQQQAQLLKSSAKSIASDLHLRLELAFTYFLSLDARQPLSNVAEDSMLDAAKVLTFPELAAQTDQAKNLDPTLLNLVVNDQNQLMIVRQTSNKGFWQAAEIRESYLWESANNIGNKVCFYFSPVHRLIYCNMASEKSWWESIQEPIQSKHAGVIQEPFATTAYWSLAEPTVANAPVFTILETSYRYDHFLTNNSLALHSSKIFGLTLLVVMLASMRIIGATLRPLRLLTDQTTLLARGELEREIQINTGDEFENLGNSFNTMAAEIADQLRAQRSLAKLGDHIQKAKTLDACHQHVMGALRDVISIDNTNVLCRSPNAVEQVTAWNVNEGTTTITETEAILPLFSPGVKILNTRPEEEQLQPLFRTAASYLIIPGQVENEVISLVICTIQAPLRQFEENFCRQLGNLHANALANLILSEQLHHQANHDYLTGLPNRLNLKSKFEEALALDQNTEFVLAIFDVDRFKAINDTLGHPAGDQLLVSIAERLRGLLPENVIASRFAGDEFVILDTSYGEAPTRTRIMERVLSPVLKTFEQPFYLENSRLRIHASIGVAHSGFDGRHFTTLLKNADLAMYEAKKNNSGSFSFNSPELQRAVLQRYEIENRLTSVTSSNELVLNYQPIIDLETGSAIGCEALLRWFKPDGKQVFPDLFIPIAEETGAIVEIGEWVLEEGCRAMKRMLEMGLNLQSMAINVSSVQLLEPNFLTTVQRTLDNTGLNPKSLELEVTETSLMDDLELVIEKLNRIRAMGIRVAIDDFGTGYSSLQYLKQLPANKLKIDRAFVQHLPADVSDLAIVKVIISLAKELNLNVLAEGCETLAQVDLLREESVKYAQGWYFSKALTEEEFISYVVEHNQLELKRMNPHR